MFQGVDRTIDRFFDRRWSR